MNICRMPFIIEADENFALVNESGVPNFSVYRRQDGRLEVFFQQMDDDLSPDEGKKIAEEMLQRWKAASLDEEPVVQIVPGPDGLTFVHSHRSKK